MREQATAWLVIVTSLVLASGCNRSEPRAGERETKTSVANAEGQEPRGGASAHDKGRPASEAKPTESEGKVHQVGELGRRIVGFCERAETAGFCGVVLAAKGGR